VHSAGRTRHSSDRAETHHTRRRRSLMFTRGKIHWFTYRHPDTKKYKNQSTYTANEEEAKVFEANFLRRLADAAAPGGPMTLQRFVTEKWKPEQVHKTLNDDLARLKKHIYPRIGHKVLTEIEPATCDGVIISLRKEATLAPGTILEIGRLMTRVFKRAVKHK